MLAEIQFAGNLAVAQSLGDECDNLFLAGSEQIISPGVEHSQRRNFRHEFDDVVELPGVSPNLPVGDPQQAFVKQTEVGVGDAEDAAHARTKCVHDEFAIKGLDEQNLANLGMCEMKSAKYRHRLCGL